jgi:hypothetical protein
MIHGSKVCVRLQARERPDDRSDGSEPTIAETCGPGLTSRTVSTKSSAAKPYAAPTAHACLTSYHVALVAANMQIPRRSHTTATAPLDVTQPQSSKAHRLCRFHP